MTIYDVTRALPDIETLRDRCRAMAALELVISGDEDDAYFSYDPEWGPGEEAALMDNGSGDDYAIVFTADGVFGHGFDHESAMSPWAGEDDEGGWPGLSDGIPEAFRSYLAEPAFCVDGVFNATAVFWRESADTQWRTGKVEFPEGRSDPDGADYLFGLLVTGTPEAYRDFAEDYYETDLPLEAVRHVWSLLPLTQAVVEALNPGLPLEAVAPRVARAGYPGV